MSLIQLKSSDFTHEVIESDIPVIVDFYADWCGPCKMLAPIINELATEYEDELKIVKLDVNDAKDIASEYDVMNIPTIILFKGGNEIERIVGFRSKEAIIEEFDL